MIAARTLITATSLGIWDELASGPASAEEVAKALELDPPGVDLLLTALASLGFLAPLGQAFALTDHARTALRSDSPESIATFVGALNAHHWTVLGRLDDVLRGEAPDRWHTRGQEDPVWAAYLRGLHEISRHEHDANAALVDLAEPRRLLDLAGGHGGFAMAMARRHPRLRATVLDLEAAARVGRRIVEEHGFADRIDFRDGDALASDLGRDVDVVSAFNLVHHLSPAQNGVLVRRAHAALRPGGQLVIGETERPGPGAPIHQLGALSGLLFYAMSGARTYRREELCRWLDAAGFREVRVHRNERSPWRIVLVATR